MGKDLKGKELGKCICQRKDGLYSARCTQHGQVVLKNVYGIPCERDMFYDRRRKFYFVLSGMR